MSALLQTFEVRVKVKRKENPEYNSSLATYCFKEVTKMFHQEARNSRQAMDKCRKYGMPISAHKYTPVMAMKRFDDIITEGVYKGEKVYSEFDSVYQQNKPYSNSTEEMIRGKRNNRRDNMNRDKPIDTI